MTDISMKGFAELTPIDEALVKFFSKINVRKMSSDEVPLIAAIDRALVGDLSSPRDVPPFDRSAVDGYALRARDTFGVSETNPIVLHVRGGAEVGRPPLEILKRNEAARIATGAPIPQEADAVVMAEFTELTRPDKVEVYRPVAPGENVSFRGEDVKKGQPVLRSGVFLKPQDIGIMAALGLRKVEVSRKPTVAVISTGSELVDAGSEMQPGKITDSNRPTLLAMLEDSGAQAVDLGIVPDERSMITERIKKSLAFDLTLVSGGTSVGERDLLPDIIDSLGKPGVLVHGIAMRPGKPVALCAIENTPIVLLPGFPVAAMIAYDVFVEPIILRMLGASTRLRARPTVIAEAMRRIPSSLGNRCFVRVVVEKRGNRYIFEPLRTTGSGIISSMVMANGMLVIPENKEGIEEGEAAKVVLLRSVEREFE